MKTRLLTKIALNIVGSIAVLLAILGVFLPLLPTTPFLLLACACYFRGSPRLYRWLVSNRILGTYILNFQSGRGIPLRAKMVSLLLTWASLSFSIYVMQAMVVKLILVAIGIAVSLIILRMKTLR
ncbi:MAG: YbaN family protein [Oxalobacteraceae bacterium]